MAVFTDAEAAYLRSQPLMRFASASPAGRPDVAPVVFELDGDDIVTSGFDISSTVRYRNIRENPRVTVVVDDLASINPWSPRGVKVIGTCVIEAHGDGERFRISPHVVISWGINDARPGIPAMERRVVDGRADAT
jgi:pyridoxamine 5'-phosphate oxidase family protein